MDKNSRTGLEELKLKLHILGWQKYSEQDAGFAWYKSNSGVVIYFHKEKDRTGRILDNKETSSIFSYEEISNYLDNYPEGKPNESR